MIKIPLHNNKKLLLSFEWGVILADVAKKQNVKLTPEIIERAEKIILQEFQTKSASKLAGEMEVIMLSIFETK
jgi:hypothetical protein